MLRDIELASSNSAGVCIEVSPGSRATSAKSASGLLATASGEWPTKRTTVSTVVQTETSAGESFRYSATAAGVVSFDCSSQA